MRVIDVLLLTLQITSQVVHISAYFHEDVCYLKDSLSSELVS